MASADRGASAICGVSHRWPRQNASEEPWPIALLRLLMVFWLAVLVIPVAFADAVIPPLQARVTDATGTLDVASRNALEAKLADFERQKSSQIAVLIVPTTQPETIEQYGIRVSEAWKIGRKDIDDGVILIVAKDDHRVRIEVGYGLEGALNDAMAKRIISETITPAFKQGKFAQGIDAGLTAMMQVIAGERLGPLPTPTKHGRPGMEWEWPSTIVGFLASIGVLLLTTLVALSTSLGLSAATGSAIAALIVAIGLGLLSCLFTADIALNIVSGVLVFVACFSANRYAHANFVEAPPQKRGRIRDRDNDRDDSDTSGSSSFSGGGGSFGGGGASGSW